MPGIHHLARPEIDLLDRAVRGRDHLALAEILLRLDERMARGLGIGGRGVDHVGAAGQLGRGDALLGLGDRGLVAIVLGDRIVELRLGGPALVEQRLGALEIVARHLQHGLRLGKRRLEHLDLVRPLHFRFDVGEPRLGFVHAGFRRRDRGLLLGAFQREDGIALLDVIAFLDAERGTRPPCSEPTSTRSASI